MIKWWNRYFKEIEESAKEENFLYDLSDEKIKAMSDKELLSLLREEKFRLCQHIGNKITIELLDRIINNPSRNQ